MGRRRRHPPKPRDPLWIANPYRTRDTLPADDWLPVHLNSIPDDYIAVPSTLTEVEDRREFYPDDRPVRSSRRRRVSLRAVPLPEKGRPYSSPFSGGVLTFNAPLNVAICVRRRRRREVLFAKGKSGRGNRRGKRNQWSNVRC